jgi:hypothetical protein
MLTPSVLENVMSVLCCLLVASSLAQSAPAAPAAPQLSPVGGNFALRIGVGDAGLPSFFPTPAARANPPNPSGTLGMSYFFTDATALVIDLGASVASAGGDLRLGGSIAAGVDWVLGDSTMVLRPLLSGKVVLERAPPIDPNNEGQDLPNLSVVLGGGAAYFFNPHFAITGRVGVGAGVEFGLGAKNPGGAVLLAGVVTPSIDASWYF